MLCSSVDYSLPLLSSLSLFLPDTYRFLTSLQLKLSEVLKHLGFHILPFSAKIMALTLSLTFVTEVMAKVTLNVNPEHIEGVEALAESEQLEQRDSVPTVSETLLDELDVVAVKGHTNYRQRSMSGNHLSLARAENLGVVGIKGMSDVVPNFYMPDYGSRITSSIYVRGIGARMDQPAVGLTVDNVGIMNKNAYDFDVADVAYVEMVRGPQSSLFGRNTMTGMINIRSISPWDYQGWRSTVMIGLRSLFKFNIGWYHQFNDKAAMSASGNFYRYGGKFINEYDDKTVDKEVYGGMRIKNYYNPSDAVKIANSFSFSLLRQGGYPYESVATGKISYNDTCFYRRFMLTDGLTVNARLPKNLTLMSVTTLQHLNDNMTLDQDFLPESYFTLTQKTRETAITQDIMLRGLALGDTYHWMVGAYGFYRHQRMMAPVTFKEEGIERLIVRHRNEANPFYPIKWDTDEMPLDSYFSLPSGGFAIYHESRYDLGRWNFAAALRLDYERISLNYDNYCDSGYEMYNNPSGLLPIPESAQPYRHVPVDISMHGSLKNDYLQFSPKVSAIYNLPDVTLGNLYASIGKGFKAGGFNTQMFSDVLQQKVMEFMGLSAQYSVEDIVSYKPEKSWSFEIGSHLNFLNSNMRVDLSVFYIDCRDQQLTVFPPGETTGRMMTNAGKTRSVGGEVTVDYNPMKTLNLMATYGFTDARFLNYESGGVSYKGKRVPYAPSNTLFLQATYLQSVSSKNLYFIELSANFNGAGSIYWNESNSLRQNFYGLLGINIAYKAPKWSLELWGNNLTNTKYSTFYFLSMGNEFLQRGKATQIGLTVRAHF